MHQTGSIQSWRDLAQAIVRAIDHLAATDPAFAVGCNIVLEVEPELAGVLVSLEGAVGRGSRVTVCNLPRITDLGREDGLTVPCGSIDRAASKAAAAMLAWYKDPDTFEVVETRRHHLLLQWPHRKPELVDEWAYGLWDE